MSKKQPTLTEQLNGIFIRGVAVDLEPGNYKIIGVSDLYSIGGFVIAVQNLDSGELKSKIIDYKKALELLESDDIIKEYRDFLIEKEFYGELLYLKSGNYKILDVHTVLGRPLGWPCVVVDLKGPDGNLLSHVTSLNGLQEILRYIKRWSSTQPRKA